MRVTVEAALSCRRTASALHTKLVRVRGEGRLRPYKGQRSGDAISFAFSKRSQFPHSKPRKRAGIVPWPRSDRFSFCFIFLCGRWISLTSAAEDLGRRGSKKARRQHVLSRRRLKWPQDHLQEGGGVKGCPLCLLHGRFFLMRLDGVSSPLLPRLAVSSLGLL